MTTTTGARRLLAVLPALGLAACGDDAKIDSGTGFNSGPTIEHDTLTNPQSDGTIEIRATATDPDGVVEVVVYHRPEGLPYWDLTQLIEGEDGEWVGEITGVAPGFDYYLRASDRFGAEGFLPVEGESDPWAITVLPAAKSVPFYEDFELDPGETSLYSLGWVTYADGFAAYNWALTSTDSASGGSSAFHARGAVEGEEMIDWLVSPPVDMSTSDRIQVTWQERGANTISMGTHGLYISATSVDPTVEGSFTAVEAELPAPSEGGFSRSAVIDLSELAGESQVYLAWLYQGEYGDDWYIDDVRIEALTADLAGTYQGQTPDPVFAGETLTVDWTITNSSAASAANFEATLSLPDGGGTVVDPTKPVPDLEGYSSAPMSWDIELDPDVPEDRYRSMLLTITDGASTWTTEDQFLVGYLSTATFDITVAERAITQIYLGVGDPAAPSLSFVAHSGYVGPAEQMVFDLTRYADDLPPEAGPGRWFAMVQADRDGVVSDFTISKGGVEYGGPESGGALFANQPTYLYVPRPAAPVVTSTEPTATVPGDTDVPVTITLSNQGADTSGPVTGTLTSATSDLTLTGGVALEVTADVWGEGETVTLSGPLASIAANHTDSTPVRATLDLTDGVDAWTVPVDISVPWRVMATTAATIDDSGGDGVLNSAESAEIELEIANMGDLATIGRMDVVAVVSPLSAVTATLDEADDRMSSLDPGDSDSIDLEVSNVSGAPGQELLLDLTFYDDTEVYTATAAIPLGELPWNTFTAPNDATGDSVDPSGTTFDFKNGRWRTHEGNIQVILESSVPYDPASLFIETWGSTSGSGYLYYRWVYNAGVPTFQGYVNGVGWQPVGTLTVLEITSTEVMLSWPIEELDTITSNMSLGFGTTWCGAPEYYCDHFPDGWGYGYDSTNFDPARWFDISW